MAVNELSKENPIGRYLQNYSDSISEEEKQRRINERSARMLKSFGGVNVPGVQEIPQALNVDKPINGSEVINATNLQNIKSPVVQIIPDTRKTAFEDQRSSNRILPVITNVARNETTGKTAALYSDGSVNGVPQPARSQGTMGGYNPDGSRIVPSGNQGDQNVLRNLSSGIQMTMPDGTPAKEVARVQQMNQQFDLERNDPVAQQNRALAAQQWSDRQPSPIVSESNEYELFTKENSPNMGWQERKAYNDQILANRQSGKNTLAQLESQQNIARNQNVIAKDENRIKEMDVTGQNTLRNIQGQVTQNPPTKQLDDSYKVRDKYNDLGQVVGNELYNERTGEPKNQLKFDESQADVIKGLQKMKQSKDPRLAAAEARYKATFGNLPY